jgi:hypothetical protein
MQRCLTSRVLSVDGLAIFATLILHASSIACASAATVPVFDLAPDPATQAATYVEVDGRKRQWKAERLAIVSFTVEFVDSHAATPHALRKKSAKKRETDGEKDNQSVAADVVIAPDTAQLQPIVDTLYDLSVEDWRSAGVEVLTPDALSALAGYADLAPALVGTPYRYNTTDENGARAANVVSAHALPAYAGAGRTPPLSAELALAKSADLILVAAHFVVDFVVVRDTDDRMFRTKLEPMYAETVRAAESGYRLIGPDGSVVRATLRSPVRAPESPITLGMGASYADDEDDVDPNKPPVQRLAINAAVYYDQSLRYLGAVQDMILAALAPR